MGKRYRRRLPRAMNKSRNKEVYRGETEILLSVEMSYVAPLKAFLEAEEGLFFMRVNETDKLVRLLIPSEEETKAERFLRDLRAIIPFQIVSINKAFPLN